MNRIIKINSDERDTATCLNDISWQRGVLSDVPLYDVLWVYMIAHGSASIYIYFNEDLVQECVLVMDGGSILLYWWPGLFQLSRVYDAIRDGDGLWWALHEGDYSIRGEYHAEEVPLSEFMEAIKRIGG